MKKIALLSLAALLFSNCDIEPRRVKAAPGHYRMEKYVTFNTRLEYYGGMTYNVWYGAQDASYGAVTIAVINITKDSLECEFYKSKMRGK